MQKIKFYDIGTIDDSEIKFAVISTKYNDKWVFVRHKERLTWEIPGGHRECQEDINDTASRELFEETGSEEYKLFPICIYSVDRDGAGSYGQLYYAEVETLGILPVSEIGEVKLFDEMPDNLTYPLIQPLLFERTVKFLANNV